MKTKRINLIPVELTSRVELTPEMVSLGISALMLLSMTTTATSNYFGIKNRKRMLASIQTEKQQLSDQIVNLTAKKDQVTKAQAKYTSVQEVLSRKTLWVEIFKELTVLMPKGVWLTSLSSTLSDRERNIILKGETSSQEKVADFFRVLEKSFYFGGIMMKTSERQENYSPNLYKFEFNIPIPPEKYGKS